jgi:hypothetical protein
MPKRHITVTTPKVRGGLSVKRQGKRHPKVAQPLSPNPGMKYCKVPLYPSGTNSVGSRSKSY